MYYDDLSPYAYFPAEEGDVFTEVSTGTLFVSVRGAYRRLNIGWLEPDVPGPLCRHLRSSRPSY